MGKNPDLNIKYLALVVLVFSIATCSDGATPNPMKVQGRYEIVFHNARVLDPETNLDAILDVGIVNNKIMAISTEVLTGSLEIDASGLVLAPGFIDLHSHSEGYETAAYQVMDGRTTRLELESGVYPVDSWYESKQGQELMNYGASVSHTAVRRHLQDQAENRLRGTLNPNLAIISQKIPEHIYEDFIPTLQQGLMAGAIGVGSGTQYAPGITRPEMLDVNLVTAKNEMCLFTHVRYGSLIEPYSTFEALQEVISNSAISGSCAHVVHINSMAMSATSELVDIMNNARSNGIDISTEMYPWDASNDRIRTLMFDPGWENRWGVTPQDLQSKSTGERLTQEEFDALRTGIGDDRVLMHMNTEETLILALQDPQMIIASDAGTLRDRFEHPRTAGTFSRVLGHFVREKKALTLMEAIRKMTLLPAQRLQDFTPGMKTKGRVQVGADADLVVFDPNLVASGATYLDAKQYSKGYHYVMVNGIFVVEEGSLVADVYPGKPVYGYLK
jgi:hypothetical protein